MFHHSTIESDDTDGHITIQRFVNESVKGDVKVIMAHLRSKFGTHVVDFRQFYAAWNVSALFCLFYFGFLFADVFCF